MDMLNTLKLTKMIEKTKLLILGINSKVFLKETDEERIIKACMIVGMPVSSPLKPDHWTSNWNHIDSHLTEKEPIVGIGNIIDINRDTHNFTIKHIITSKMIQAMAFQETYNISEVFMTMNDTYKQASIILDEGPSKLRGKIHQEYCGKIEPHAFDHEAYKRKNKNKKRKKRKR